MQDNPILEQLKLEEALLRVNSENWCIINSGSLPAIVMGISGKVEDFIHPDKFQLNPVPIIRRFSGGGTVFIDANTFFITFIFNTSSAAIAPFPRTIMAWTEQIYRPVFKSAAFKLEETDYVMGQHKFGGNAQSICKDRWLHHSSFLWDYCPTNMDVLLHPKKVPQYRLGRPHQDFLCKLKDFYHSPHELTNRLKKELSIKFCLNHVNFHDIRSVVDTPHRKATTLVDINSIEKFL